MKKSRAKVGKVTPKRSNRSQGEEKLSLSWLMEDYPISTKNGTSPICASAGRRCSLKITTRLLGKPSVARWWLRPNLRKRQNAKLKANEPRRALRRTVSPPCSKTWAP